MDLQIQLRQPAGRDGRLFLQGHLARPNPQIADFDGEAEALAMFAGPHAYISPSWYETGPAVPTRNYASVHAYGPAQRIDDPEWLRGFGVSRNATKRASPRRADGGFARAIRTGDAEGHCQGGARRR